MHAIIEQDLSNVDASQWNAMVPHQYPFLQHAFLSGLQETGCVCEDTGWQPQHILVYRDEHCAELLGALPCYLKYHSYGEYVFDWAWADAYQQAGHSYYPKLLCAIPFTPASGPRWLISNPDDADTVTQCMIDTATTLARQHAASSIHFLFTDSQTNQQLADRGFVQRNHSQFQWRNDNYQDFAGFLSRMNAKKRKNIKRERRRIDEAGIEYRWHNAEQLSDSAIAHMFAFYQRTIRRYGAQQYLTPEFFHHLHSQLADHTHVLLAYHNDTAIAGGLYFSSADTLYGRYWGALDDFHSLHFETCYYQPIDYAIKRGYQRFEAGAQGEHKLARGLLPSDTYSMHWLANPQFKHAVARYTEMEAERMARYTELLNQHSPFREV